MTDHPPVAEPATTDESSTTAHAAADPPVGFTVQFTPERDPRRRIRYEPRTHADGWWRITDEWTGCSWRIVGREPVVDVVVRRGHND